MFLILKEKLLNKHFTKYGDKFIKNLRQGKYIEIELNESDEKKAHNIIEDMCKKLLVNLIIEEYKIKKFNEFICYCFSWIKL